MMKSNTEKVSYRTVRNEGTFYRTVKNDTFFCEEVSEGFTSVGELEFREFEGNEYTNFSNVVRVTSCGVDPVLGIGIGDYVLVHHVVADNILKEDASNETLVFYEENVFGISKTGYDVDDFTMLDKYVLTEEMVEIDTVYTGSFDLKNDESRLYSKVYHSEAYLEANPGTDNEIVEYVINSDYEVYIGGEMYFVIDKENMLNRMVEYIPGVTICRSKDVLQSVLTGKTYVREENELGELKE